MTRKAVLRGTPVPKSRAKLRGRLDRDRAQRERSNAPGSDALSSWLSDWLSTRSQLSELRALDLTAVVRESANLGPHAAERLRRLAVCIDEERLVDARTGLDGWQVFARIYEAAKRLDPNDPQIRNSEAISALELYEASEDTDAGAPKLLRIALWAADEACRLAPQDPSLHYTRGRVFYESRPPQLEDALNAFEKAVGIAPGLPWANLYRAHCLHDMERWEEAAVAYASVNAASLGSGSQWRLELLIEQRSYCLLKSGRPKRALEGFIEVLRRREAAIERGEDGLSAVLFIPPYLLVEASRTALRSELFERVEKLLRSFAEWQPLLGAP